MKTRMRAWAMAGLMAAAGGTARGEVYCFGFLKTHPERAEIDKSKADEIQAAHMAHMTQMSKEGRLVAAGPMAKAGPVRGIVVYRCGGLEEAQGWADADPAVKAKRLVAEMHRWRGPEGVGEPLMTALKTNPNAPYKMVQLPLVVLRRVAGAKAGGGTGEYWESLRREGRLRAGGEVEGSELVGIYVLAAMEEGEAARIAEGDPAVKRGEAKAEVHGWYVADEVMPRAVR